MTTQPESLPSTGLMFTESEMLELAERTTSQPLIVLPAASPVKTLAKQDSAKDWPASDRDSGLILSESFASFDPDTCLWKTYQTSWNEGWAKFSGRWPRSGTMRNGKVYTRRPLVPRISESESYFLLTPSVTLQLADHCSVASLIKRGLKHHAGHLGEQLAQRYGVKPSPGFVEMMMGFPLGWTDLED